jgi:hypothetical protein
MCCYVRHIKGVLAEAGLPDTLPGRREADRRIRRALGMGAADCPEVWRRIKPLDPADVQGLLRPEAGPVV